MGGKTPGDKDMGEGDKDMGGKTPGDKDMGEGDKDMGEGDKDMGGKSSGGKSKSQEEEDEDDSAEKRVRESGMKCEDYKQRWFFNPESRKCEEMQVCQDMDFNSFTSVEECCNLCGSGNRCKAGECPKINPNMYMPSKNECRSDSDCKGNRICCYGGYATACKLPVASGRADEVTSKCQNDRFEAKRAMGASRIDGCAINYVPSCDERTGMYSRQQCQTALGVCWCVTDHGNYIADSMTHGVAQCEAITDLQLEMADKNPLNISSVQFDVCPDKPVHCCNPALCMKKCRGHPSAVCRVNPCGGCVAEYFDASGAQVNCSEGLSSCEQELKSVADVILERRITASYKLGLDEADDEDLDVEAKQYIDDMEDIRIIRDEVPLRCQQLPSNGDCEGAEKAWFYHPDTRQCSMFLYGMCGGNDNRFKTVEDCYSVCDPSSNPCARIRCGEPNPTCKIIYAEDCYNSDSLCHLEGACTSEPSVKPNANMPAGIFVPQCLSSGYYNMKQCHGSYCWCVDGRGEYTGGLSSRPDPAELECEENGPSKYSVISMERCPDGSDPRVKCLKKCTNKACPGHPKAVCKVDLCSDSCATKFVDEETSQEVKCGKDSCQLFKFDKGGDDDQCKSEVLCDGNGVKTCPRDVCENAKETLCPKNPCAVCVVDPCTCQPSFVDVTTKKPLNHKQCHYVTKGACHMKTCNMLIEMEAAKRSGIEIKETDLPECKKNGRFEPKQCSSSSDCHCVGEDGLKVGEMPPNGKCNAIKKTKKVKMVLSFDEDFDQMEQKGLLRKFERGVLKYLMEDLGIPEENIKIGTPRPGSVKLDVEIVESEDAGDSEDAPDLGLYASRLEQVIDSGNMVIDVDGDPMTVDPVASSVVASAEEDDDDDDDDDDADMSNDDDDDGLSKRDIVIIAAVGGAAGLALLILVAYCCCKERKRKEPVDDTFTHERHQKKQENIYDNPDMTFRNKGYQPDQDHYMKVRL